MKVIECIEQGGGGEVVSVDPTVMLWDEDRERCECTQTDKLGFVGLNSKYEILSRFQTKQIQYYHVLPKLKRKWSGKRVV